MWYKHKDFIDFKKKDVIESYLSEKYKDQSNMNNHNLQKPSAKDN